MQQRATHRESFFVGVRKLSRSHWGMMLAHSRRSYDRLGIAFSQNFSVERCENESWRERTNWSLRFLNLAGVTDENGPNYIGGKAQIDISKRWATRGKFIRRKHVFTQ